VFNGKRDVHKRVSGRKGGTAAKGSIYSRTEEKWKGNTVPESVKNNKNKRGVVGRAGVGQ